jgi:alpha-tubulin suppressor-like RCC1 family protein
MDDGQLGGAMPNGHAVTTVVAPSGLWARLIGGSRGSCGITEPGTIACWGVVGAAIEPTPLVLSSPEAHDFTDSSSGDDFTCATRSTDRARVCWGDNTSHQMGDGGTAIAGQPMALDIGQILQQSTSWFHGCAVTTSGGISCWGDPNYGETGQPGAAPTPMPVSDANMPLVGCSAVSTTTDHTCALCGGQPYCWGADGACELGRGGVTPSTYVAAPVVVPLGHTFVDISAYAGGGCAIDNAGHLYCWGEGATGEAGNGTHGSNVPVPVLTTLR